MVPSQLPYASLNFRVGGLADLALCFDGLPPTSVGTALHALDLALAALAKKSARLACDCGLEMRGMPATSRDPRLGHLGLHLRDGLRARLVPGLAGCLGCSHGSRALSAPTQFFTGLRSCLRS